MKVWGFMLALLCPCLVNAEQQYYGAPVASVAIEGAPSQTDLDLLPVRPGVIITIENIRASIQALHDTGKYAYIEVDATAGGSGVALIFRVRPHFFFSTMRLDPENLLDRPLSGYVRTPVGQKFSQAVVDRITQESIDLLRNQGYFEASIKPQVQMNATTRLASVIFHAEPGERATIGNIQISGGAETFDAAELLDAFDVETDDEYYAPELDEGVAEIRQKFLDLGFLNTRVTLEPSYQAASNRVDLNITVDPGQFTLVETRGFDVSRNRLRELIPIFEEGTVDNDLVEEGRVSLEEYLNLEGYFEASVSAETIVAPLDNAIQINYTVQPGERHSINSIDIEGNDFFSDRDILRSIQVREAGLFDKGVFSPEILKEDARTIELLYRGAGFEGTAVTASFEERNHSVDLLIRIEEGTQLPIGQITFLGNYDVSSQELTDAIELKEGDTHNVARLNAARNALTSLYFSRGYADVRVEAVAERIPTNHGLQIRFSIVEGQSYRIGTIMVAGNELTQEKIIHRYSNLYPDTPYNPEAILEGQQRLYSTGHFARVEIVTLDEDLSTVRNLLIQVEDASPILLTYGIGAGEFEDETGRTVEVRGTVEVSHNNLFGLDRAITVRTRGGRREQRIQATYREPRLFNWDLDGFVSTLVERYRHRDYDASRFDVALQILKHFSPQRNLHFFASYQTVDLKDIRVNPRADESTEEGIIQIARLGGSLIQDRRDDVINPTTGTFNTTTLQIANQALGSEVNFTSLFTHLAGYWSKGPGVIAQALRIGWAQPYGGTATVPITERFFAGGSTTLRGFDQDEALLGGGNLMTVANIEYRVPLTRFPVDGIVGALFYDTGNVFAEVSDFKLRNFTHTAGLGLRYQTPLGPVRLDFGFNLYPRRRPDGTLNELLQVFFTLGNPF